jgi:hypothetical protein
MLFQPYHSSLPAGQIREYLKAYPDHAPVRLDGGDDWSDGHTLYATKPKELYMPSQESLSRRLGPVFAEVAAKAQPRMTMEQHKAEYRARPVEERLRGVGASPAKEYKPTHGGYPG